MDLQQYWGLLKAYVRCRNCAVQVLCSSWAAQARVTCIHTWRVRTRRNSIFYSLWRPCIYHDIPAAAPSMLCPRPGNCLDGWADQLWQRKLHVLHTQQDFLVSVLACACRFASQLVKHLSRLVTKHQKLALCSFYLLRKQQGLARMQSHCTVQARQGRTNESVTAAIDGREW